MTGSATLSILAVCGALALLGTVAMDLLAVHATRRQAQTAADAAALAAAQVLSGAWRDELGESGLDTSRLRRHAAACRALRSARGLARDRARAYVAAAARARLEDFRLLPDGRVEVRAAVPLRLHVARRPVVWVPATAAARPYLGDMPFPGCR